MNLCMCVTLMYSQTLFPGHCYALYSYLHIHDVYLLSYSVTFYFSIFLLQPFEVSMSIDDHSQHFHHAQIITPSSNVIHHPHSYPYLFQTTNTSTTTTTTINTTTSHISSASSSTQFNVNPLMEQFSTIPPHDRIGSYLKSLGELDTSGGRHHRCNELPTFAYHQSQPNESNLPTDILGVNDKTFNHPSNFLHYLPPPPPAVPPPPHSSIMECCNSPLLPPTSTTNNASIQLR